MDTKNTAVKKDGKRSIIVTDGICKHGVGIHVCTNGFQTTIVNMDTDMLAWLKDAIDEYLAQTD